jgi:hypothetical protein
VEGTHIEQQNLEVDVGGHDNGDRTIDVALKLGDNSRHVGTR